MSKPTWQQVFRYRFDAFMARGGSSIFLSLLVVFVTLLIVLGSLRGISMLIEPSGVSRETFDSFWGQLYIIFLAMTDPGNMNQDKFSSPFFKITAVMAGLAGVIILSMLIAFITTALDQKLAQLKKGHSKVIEEDHTLILGWNDRVVEILRELALANESEDDPCVVILSDRDKEFMDDYLGVHLPDTQNTRVVTRSGSISSLVNLEITSVTTCKSVIVLAHVDDVGSAEAKSASDTKVIKTILGVMASKPDDGELNIVAELFSERNRKIAADISPDEVTTINALDVLAKILVQTSRSVGLSVVYNEIMSFDGCEMYFYKPESGGWGDIDFGRLQFHFPDGVPMGIRGADGEIAINPPIDRKLQAEDDVLILADDDSTIEFRDRPVAESRDLALKSGRLSKSVEREMIIGWNAKAPIVVREYADYVLENSTIDVMIEKPDERTRREIEQLKDEIETIEISLIEKDPLRPEQLIEVEPFKYDNILILSHGRENSDPETTDSETIVILLLLRQIFDAQPEGSHHTKLITEIMDSENYQLVARAGVNDFIISNRLVSMLLAQISEEADIRGVYDNLFEEDGSEIYLKPASVYFDSFPTELSFADMMGIAQKRQEVCLGVKIKARERDIEGNFGVKLIPEKNTRFTIVEDDCLIVVSEDET